MWVQNEGVGRSKFESAASAESKKGGPLGSEELLRTNFASLLVEEQERVETLPLETDSGIHPG